MAEQFDIQGIDNVLKMLQSLPPEVVAKRGGPVRAALAKGARLIRDEEIKNLRATLDDPDLTTGLLAENIVATRGKAPTGGNGERYLVRVKRKTYARTKGKAVTTLQVAQLKEHGSSKQPAEPFILPAFNATARPAIDLVTATLAKNIDRIAKKYLK